MVLHVLNAAGGGAALSTLAIVDALAREGIGACAVCHDTGSADERERLRDAVQGRVLFRPLYWWNRKIRAALWKRPLHELRQVVATGWSYGSSAAVARFAAAQGADSIHTNTFLTPEGGLAARRLGLPHVWHLRELLGPNQPFRLGKSGPRLQRYLERHTSLIVANSHTAAATAGDSLPAELVRIVPNGIDLSAFSPRRKPRPLGRPTVVGMVAALTSRTKRHSLFVEAATRLKDLPNVDFRVYGIDPAAGGGRDPYAAELHRRVVAAGLGERFQFAGHMADPARIMAELDILVHPAENESFGRVAVEAMADGLPVVGVRGGGVSEIVVDGQTGLLASPHDSAGLATCIERLVRDPALAERLGAAGRQRAEANYSLAAYTSGILAVYEEAMQRPVSSHPANRPR
jgi:glycosyltransferase involved in cell wall biosynthesis